VSDGAEDRQIFNGNERALDAKVKTALLNAFQETMRIASH